MSFFKKILIVILFPFVVGTRYFKSFLLILLFLIFVVGLQDNVRSGSNNGNLVELQLVGAIFDSSEMIAQIQEVSRDDQVKGVLIVVDSPGGALSPSVEIYEEIKRLSLKKPVVVYAQGALASGSYYAVLGAHRIVANKGAMIGSIGVIFDGMNVSELMGKIGVKPQVLKAGKYKEIGTMTREWEEFEKQELQNLLYRQYDMFVRDVALARELKYEDKDIFAEGRVFDARRALEIGLIDALGIKSDAKSDLVKLAGLEGQETWREIGGMERLLGRIGVYLNETVYTLMLKGWQSWQ